MATTDARQTAILRAIADETRIRLVRLLAREELSVQELCEILSMAQPKVSRHLSVLRGVTLVKDQREGTRVYYSLTDLHGDLALIADYIAAIRDQAHPDLDKLDVCLRRRASLSLDFAARRANEWDEIGMQLHSSTAALVALASLAPRGLSIADLGTGTGLLLPILATFADTVYAIDHSAEMLEHAAKRCADHGLTNVKFVTSDLESLDRNLPVQVDCILLHFVLHQLASPATTLRHLAPLLKPGGRIVIVDRVKHEDESARARFGSLWLGFEESRIDQWLEAAGLTPSAYQILRSATAPVDEIPVFILAASAPARPLAEAVSALRA